MSPLRRARPGVPARLAAALALAVSLVLVTAACGDDGAGAGVPEDVIEREAFIRTYVDLRIAALTDPSGELVGAERARILSSHGLEEQDLLDFVEVHGRDVDYMRDLWDEVQLRLDEARNPPDSTAG